MEQGLGRILACKEAKVPYRQFRQALREDADFAEGVRAAEAMLEERAVLVLLDGINAQSQQAANSMLSYRGKLRAMHRAAREGRHRRSLEERKLALEEEKLRLLKGGARDEEAVDFSGLTDGELEALRKHDAGEPLTDAECLTYARASQRVLAQRRARLAAVVDGPGA